MPLCSYCQISIIDHMQFTSEWTACVSHTIAVKYTTAISHIIIVLHDYIQFSHEIMRCFENKAKPIYCNQLSFFCVFMCIACLRWMFLKTCKTVCIY